MNIIIENVRCFAGKHVIPLSPLTLLVGENSSGKSTFLAILSVLTRTSGFPFFPGFNTSPYDLGGFDTIATRRLPNGKPAKWFKLGFTISEDKEEDEQTVLATYKGKLGQVMVYSLEIRARKWTIFLSIDRGQVQGQIDLSGFSGQTGKVIPFSVPVTREQLISLDVMSLIVMAVTSVEDEKAVFRLFATDLIEEVRKGFQPFANVRSLSPVRSKPRRTYDQFNDDFKPEGDHVPLQLARVFESAEDGTLRKEIQSLLRAFGQESGLFETVEIQRLGTTPSAPFQVIVETGDLSLNLIDVGYGVSQSLPIIVQSILSKPDSLLLMQQPEVHLHPKAQAALGTFFAKLCQTGRVRFAIETHSDFLVDRVRQEIANGTISAEDVSILFFEKENNSAVIHAISLDENGNIVNAPSGYREFFLEEEIKLLSRGQD